MDTQHTGNALVACLSSISGILFYIYSAYSLQVIAKKTNTENAWFAWIPILNFYLMLKIAGQPGWWLLLFLIPLVNVIIAIVIWIKIAEAVNKPSWWGILMLVPIVNLIVPGYLAFAE